MKPALPWCVPPPRTPHLASPTTAHFQENVGARDEVVQALFETLDSARRRRPVRTPQPGFEPSRQRIKAREEKRPEHTGKSVEFRIFLSSPDRFLPTHFILHVSLGHTVMGAVCCISSGTPFGGF